MARWRYGAWIGAVACVLAIAGCGGGTTSKCAAGSGAEACLVGSSPNVHIELTGFQPSSEVTVTRDGPANPQVSEPGAGSRPVGGPDPAAPLVFRVAADGTNGGAVLGIVGSTGPVTLTLSGTAATGTAVVLSLVAE